MEMWGISKHFVYETSNKREVLSIRVDYQLLCPMAKVWHQLCNKILIPKTESSIYVSQTTKYVIYHLKGVPLKLVTSESSNNY